MPRLAISDQPRRQMVRLGWLFLGLFLGLISSQAALLSDSQVSRYNLRVGSQTFSPRYKFTSDTKLVETSDALRLMGSDVLKFYMGKNYSGQYGITLPGSIASLTEMAQNETSCRHVLDTDFRHFLIWVYTFASNGNDSWWANGYSASEKLQEYNEIYGFAQYLLTNYNNSGKSFYFGHWEGDWYLISPSNTSVNPSPTAMQGMIDWLNNRQQAVDDALRDTPHTNVFLYNYTEANRVRDAMENPPTSNQRVINTVVPAVTNLDYVSWSSYDGMNLDSANLTATLNYMEGNLPTNKAATIPGKRIIIGEYGWGGSLSSAAQEPVTRAYIQKLISWGAPFILFWQMYDNENLSYWLIDSTNTKSPCYYLHQWFVQRARLLVAQFKETSGRLPTDSEFAALTTPLLDQSLTAPVNLSVVNLSLSELSATTATVNGKIAQGLYGSEQATVRVFWGKQDGGTNSVDWEQSVVVGLNTNFNPTTFSAALADLIPKTNYYFRFYATNSTGEAWAPSSTPFSTDVLDTNLFGSRMKISLNGYTRAEPLINFPLLITLHTNRAGFSYRQFASRTGGDLRFTDATGTQTISHEIDEWNTNGTSLVWVRIPTLTSNDFVWAYWGNPMATNPPNSSTNGSVWAQDFELVWHLKETTFPFADSTLKHPAATGGLPTATPTAYFGRGLTFNGSSHYLSAGVVNLGEQFTLSGWIKVDPSATTIQSIWANKAAGLGPSGIALFANSFQSKDQKLILETCNGSATSYGATDTNLITLGQWKHVAVAVDRTIGKSKFYVDGAERTVAGDARSDFANQELVMLGRFTNSPIASAYPFKGVMDEMRIESTIRSSNWIWATAINTPTNTTFPAFSGTTRKSPGLLAYPRTNAVTLSWESFAVGLNLYTTTNLSSPTPWSPATNVPVLLSNQWQVTLPFSPETNRFYQLRLP